MGVNVSIYLDIYANIYSRMYCPPSLKYSGHYEQALTRGANQEGSHETAAKADV